MILKKAGQPGQIKRRKPWKSYRSTFYLAVPSGWSMAQGGQSVRSGEIGKEAHCKGNNLLNFSGILCGETALSFRALLRFWYQVMVAEKDATHDWYILEGRYWYTIRLLKINDIFDEAHHFIYCLLSKSTQCWHCCHRGVGIQYIIIVAHYFNTKETIRCG